MLSEIISQVAVHIVATLILIGFTIPGLYLFFVYYLDIKKILIEKKIPKWVISTMGFFTFVGGIVIPFILGAELVDYLGLEMFDINETFVFPIMRFIINLLRDFLHILLSFF